MDKRRYYEKLKSGHVVDVNPDIQADFTSMPFNDDSFDLVVFDPPLNSCWENELVGQEIWNT